MKRFLYALMLLVAGINFAFGQIANTPPRFQLDQAAHDWTGDSRTADIQASPTCGLSCGDVGTNWFAVANALSGQRWKIN